MKKPAITKSALTLAIACSSLSLIPLTAVANISSQPSQPQENLQAQASLTPQITEQKLIAAAKGLETAWEQKNIKSIMQYMAPFTISKLVFEAEGNAQTVYLTGATEHQEFFTKAFSNSQTSEKKKLQEKLRISPDGSVGTVRTTTLSFVTTNNQRWVVTSTDTVNFGMIGDRVVVVSIDSNSRFDPRPTPR